MGRIFPSLLVPLALVAQLWLLGLTIAWAGRGRIGPGQVLAAFPIAFGLVTAVPLVQVFVPRIRFDVQSLLVGWVVVMGFARVTRRWWPNEPTQGWSGARAAAATAGVLFLSVVVAHGVVWAAGGGTWETVSQTWDAFFDTNAIRHAFETRDVAPSRISDFAYPAPAHTWYPTSFHAVGVLAMQLGARDAVVASNLAASVVAGALWPSTVALAARAILGRSRWVTLTALTLWWGFWGMPWAPLEWGVLWATALSTAYTPLAIAGFAGVLGLGVDEGGRQHRARKVVLLLVGLLAVGVAHPRVLLILSVLLLGLWTCHWGTKTWELRGRLWNRRRALTLAALVLPLLGLLFAVFFVARDSIRARTWEETHPLWEELIRYVVGAPVQTVPQVLAAILTAIGMSVVLRSPRWRWLGLLALGAVALDVITAVCQGVTVTNGLTRFWYNDRFRTVGLVSFPLLLVAMKGASCARAWWARRRGSSALPGVVLLTVAIIVGEGAWGAQHALRRAYVVAANHPQESLVTADERRFFSVISSVVPPGERVLNNPHDGSAFLYAYEGVLPVFVMAGSTRANTVNGYALHESLVTEDPAQVCRRLRDDHIGWVLNGGQTYNTKIIRPEPAPGMQVTPAQTFLTEVRRGADFTLYQVTGCPAPG